MIKTAIAIALLVVGTSFAYAQGGTNRISDSFEQFRKDQNEQRTELNRQGQAIEQLRKERVANNAAAPAPTGAIDYTRYNRIASVCTTWTPNPTTKDEDAKRYNSYTREVFVEIERKCMRKQTNEDLATDARRAEKRVRFAQQQIDQQTTVPPPAPGAIQDDEAAPMTADLRDDDAVPAPQQAGFYDQSYNYGYQYGYRRYGVVARQSHCSPGFRYDPRERSCLKYTAVDVNGPSPYNVSDDVARCVPGTTRSIWVQGPFGRRKVDQVCRVHH